MQTDPLSRPDPPPKKREGEWGDDNDLDVAEARSGEEAIPLLEALQPDFLVSDHLMPGMAGTDLARIAIARQPSLKVLIISGYAELEGIPADLRRLSKPFRLSELASAMTGFGS